MRFDDEWVFNLADLVIQSQTVTDDGTKLLQLRFYPVATTTFLRRGNSGTARGPGVERAGPLRAAFRRARAATD